MKLGNPKAYQINHNILDFTAELNRDLDHMHEKLLSVYEESYRYLSSLTGSFKNEKGRIYGVG